jgi:hypothetical protein
MLHRVTIVVLSVLSLGSLYAAETQGPKLVIILADDLGWMDVSPSIVTPHHQTTASSDSHLNQTRKVGNSNHVN